MRGKYSPTVIEREANPQWWAQNGGGYGLLADGSRMSETYHTYDHEGFDRFGYDRAGLDRAGNSVRDYQVEETYNEVLTRGLPVRSAKSVSEYWHAVGSACAVIKGRFPDFRVLDPQDERPPAPHIAVYVAESGGYGVRLSLDEIGGTPRSLDIVFDGIADPKTPPDAWSVAVTARSGGETRRLSKDGVGFGEAMAHVRDAVCAYDPDRRLFDVLVCESGDGQVYLESRHRAERSAGDILGTVYASDRVSAIEAFARRYQPGGTIQRMAARGLRRMEAEMQTTLGVVNSNTPAIDADTQARSVSRTTAVPRP